MPILQHLLAGALVASAAAAPAATVTAHAAKNLYKTPNGIQRAGHPGRGPMDVKDMTVGKVTAINGTTITIEGRESKTFTVDTTNAKILKGNPRNPETGTVADVKVGDMVMAHGTVNGTSVAATEVHLMGAPGERPFHAGMGDTPTAGGKITAINGSVITVQGRDGKVLTIDATNAKLSSGFPGKTTTIVVSDLNVGDMVTAHGTLDGTTVTATDVHDMGTMPEPGKGFGKLMGRFHAKR